MTLPLKLPTPPSLPPNLPPLPSSNPSSSSSRSSPFGFFEDSIPSSESTTHSRNLPPYQPVSAKFTPLDDSDSTNSNLGAMGKSLLSSNLSPRVAHVNTIAKPEPQNPNNAKPQDAGPAFYSATSRDLLRLIRNNQRALRNTLLEIERCKLTGQEALRICKLMQSQPESQPSSSSTSPPAPPPPLPTILSLHPPQLLQTPHDIVNIEGYEADADDDDDIVTDVTDNNNGLTALAPLVPSELSPSVPSVPVTMTITEQEFDVRTPESSLPSRSTYFASSQALSEEASARDTETLRSSLDYDPNQYRPTLEELLPHFARLRQEARLRSNLEARGAIIDGKYKTLPPQLPLYVSSPDPPPQLSKSPPKPPPPDRRSPTLQEAHFRRTPKREASVMASMYVAPKLSPHRTWRERSSNAKLGCMRTNSLKRISPPFIYDKPSFVGLPTKVEEEESMKRRHEAVGHPKRNAQARRHNQPNPVPPPNSPPRQKRAPHSHRKLYYSPYKGIAYSVASKKVIKFVTTLSNGGSSSFESSGNSFIRPISRPARTGGGGRKTEVVRSASEDQYWNLKPFRPGAVERRFLASKGVGEALTWKH
ncbi:hypothetical protein TrLO_g9637 [Triparma laevis f. longispina]|uniref:Uncharacterized protein n=1 Tax=Triparma laevis f. longispina TaxID=1714387 RepID=A0A9W7FQF9_9STRA|nr:hypothetical protein TrLO_g9637 [Triparma laevis f. longispina]